MKPRPLEEVARDIVDCPDISDELIDELREALAEREKEITGPQLNCKENNITVADSLAGLRSYVYINPPQINGR